MEMKELKEELKETKRKVNEAEDNLEEIKDNIKQFKLDNPNWMTHPCGNYSELLQERKYLRKEKKELITLYTVLSRQKTALIKKEPKIGNSIFNHQKIMNDAFLL